MTTTHTPGPWRIVDGTEIRGPARICDRIICNTADYRIPGDTSPPDDARLIAAAPDLLAALRELVQGVHDEFSCSHPLRAAADRARAAIAAATTQE